MPDSHKSNSSLLRRGLRLVSLTLLLAHAVQAQSPRNVPPKKLASASEGTAINGIQLVAKLEQQVPGNYYYADQPVIVDFTIKNTSKKSVDYDIVDAEQHFIELAVTKGDGKVPALTQYGKTVLVPPDPHPSHMNRGSLSAGEEEHYRVLVSWLYDMTLYGKYTIRGTWYSRSGVEGKPNPTVSNPVEVTIGGFNWSANPHRSSNN